MQKKTNTKKILYFSKLITPLGEMCAVGDEVFLYLLEFVEKKGWQEEWKSFTHNCGMPLLPGRTPSIDSIEKELGLYFESRLGTFKTPVTFLGTPFQCSVWNALKKIPRGQTRSYAEISEAIGNPNAYRAVARANAANRLAIIIPCHRVIYADGSLGGYAGGVERKRQLLAYEKQAVISEKGSMS